MNKRTGQIAHTTVETQNVVLDRLQEGRQVMNKEVVQPIQIMLLTIPQVAKSLGLSRAKVYLLISNEGLPVVRFGRAMRVSPASLNYMVTEEGTKSHSLVTVKM